MKPPVKIETNLVRRHDGYYQIGVSFDGGPWVWSVLKARRRDVAAKNAPEAIAHIMVDRAKMLEQQASDLQTKAAFLRDCARIQGVM
jgi:hypothetical protein